MAKVTFQGNPVTTNGELPAVGSKAPNFNLPNSGLEERSLDSYAGKKRLLNIVPSLDTGVCAASARKFNETFAGRSDAVALVISADLPFAAGRFCSTEGLENVETLSLVRSKNFAKDYGVLITDGPLEGLAARAVVVVDEGGTVIYTQLVPEIAEEPDYNSAMAALS